jgi:hypothetical protein
MAWAVDSAKAKACLRRHTRQCGALARAAAAVATAAAGASGTADGTADGTAEPLPPLLSLEPFTVGWWLVAKTELHRLLRSQPAIFGVATPGWEAGNAAPLDAAALQRTELWLTCSVSKNGLFDPFIYKNEHFTKIGSGQT